MGFASLGASHASPLQAANAPPSFLRKDAKNTQRKECKDFACSLREIAFACP